MSYYNVLILTRKNKSGHDYQSESVYFGENERLMQVGFIKQYARLKGCQMQNT